MNGMQQNAQQVLDRYFGTQIRKESEPTLAEHKPESPAEHEPLTHVMDEILDKENLDKALKRVIRNKGGPGVDGMTVKELPAHLESSWPNIERQIRDMQYKPAPVKRVEIPKPNGGTRKLGIPTVTDRYIQQAIHQVLQTYLDPTFSEHSYGFRPHRSAHQAISESKMHIHAGYCWVVDLDLERFFDHVNHDILMALLAKRVRDKRLLKLVRGYLNSGILDEGLMQATTEGTPQGGPLSPLLSNIVLDVLDKELESRGHRFVRYADDCNIYVKSERAGKRVKRNITRFLSKKLKLKVNEEKSAVGQPSDRVFLGFSFTRWHRPRICVSRKALAKFKARVKEITNRHRGRKLEEVIKELNRFLRGWGGYFGFCETRTVFKGLNSWIRRRLRCLLWKRWKTPRNRFKELMSRGVYGIPLRAAGSRKGPWRLSASFAVKAALPDKYFRDLGLVELQARKPS